MFKTFKTSKKEQRGKTERANVGVGRTRIKEEKDQEMVEEEESPFDMAPEMNKVMFKGKKDTHIMENIA